VPASAEVISARTEVGSDATMRDAVMGGYGHSRLREFIFGGFTRHILDGVDLPVLVFH
jgi:nucleotide-binding universal stress UspA family protein